MRKTICLLSAVLILASLASCALPGRAQPAAEEATGATTVEATSEQTIPRSETTTEAFLTEATRSETETTEPAATTEAQTVPTTAKKKAPATTTKKATTTVPTTKSAQQLIRDAFNRAELHPLYTGTPEMDNRVQRILAAVTTPDMPTYDKVKAVYDYIILNLEYGGCDIEVPDGVNLYINPLDARMVVFANGALAGGYGVCDDYAAAFLILTRAIGLDCWYTGGYTTNTRGIRNGHVWNTITVEGTDYLFDTQVEDKKSANGIQYMFFCKPYNDGIVQRVYSGYDLEKSKASFGYFEKAVYVPEANDAETYAPVTEPVRERETLMTF